ncbi:uncharacterized protein CEXT_539731 [Caerostris extrusa]|uniref:Uncharacterized protein n=1 Tax=Caerostris extrusa TaxID=172846 RepID=A0AAV4W7J3_CAEEX|nr:uncharacterized protein CEXT_539731 [Caerostris extrusa]
MGRSDTYEGRTQQGTQKDTSRDTYKEGEEVAKILVVEGQVAVLPCASASKSLEPTVKTTLLRWFHNNFYKPVYTLDVRHINQPSQSHIWLDSRARHFPVSRF